ncbi:ABC transporter ATP-binding protein [Leucobacter sp. USHLN153]|uniref:ABC transporter ATP-binding protein n=1 Tax=Leucobacter sp. USHLN153 TaxID=3081268 RepID=UPI00301A33CA
MTLEKPVIVAHEIVKTFKLKHNHTFKETFLSLFRKKVPGVGEFRAVDGVSFEVSPGESVALLGKNGSGKSTTLKVISGVLQPDSGWVRTHGRVGGLLEVGAGFHPDLTGRDNVFLNAAILGMSKKETEALFADIVDFAGISEEFLDTEVKRYSSGMKSRLGFAVAIHTHVDVLLVDEVLSVGDAEFRAKCNERLLQMREQNKSMFIVSHNIGTIKKLCDRGIVLQKGRVIFDGPIEEAATYVTPPKRRKKRVQNFTEFSVAPQFHRLFANPERKLGQPVENAVEITENGGGLSQRFTRSLATYSVSHDKISFISSGKFLQSYLENGGPSGPWGFPLGRAQGSFVDGGTRSIQFQHGVASSTAASEVLFTPHERPSEQELSHAGALKTAEAPSSAVSGKTPANRDQNSPHPMKDRR